jgi:hypothetical protein
MGRITRVVATLVVSGLCGVGVTAAAQATNGGKVLLCHGTASDSNPYVLIRVGTNAAATHLNGHGQNNHPDFLLPDGRTDCSAGPTTSGE